MTAANQLTLNDGSESCNTMVGNTSTTKGRSGWECKTDVALGHLRLLRITTSKSERGGVTTSARVFHRESGGLLRTELFGDFSKCCASNSALRCLEKTVAAQHFCVLQTLDQLKSEVEAFYLARPAKPWVVVAPPGLDETSVVADFQTQAQADAFLASMDQPACMLRRCPDGSLSVNY